MPERADIEAVVAAALREFRHGPHSRDETIAATVRFTLDRVRGARGDDEATPACVREYHAMLAGDVDFVRAQRAKARADIEAARSPQGEDHEAGLLAAFESMDTEMSEAMREGRLVDGRAAMTRAIDAYLRVATARDGTVAEIGRLREALHGLADAVNAQFERGEAKFSGTVLEALRVAGEILETTRRDYNDGHAAV